MPRIDTAFRIVAAPPDRVFSALIDPEALTAWLPPSGMSGRFERYNARPGGTYRMVLTYADASSSPGKATADSDIVEARFVEVAPGERLVQTIDFVTDAPDFVGTHDSDMGNDAGRGGNPRRHHRGRRPRRRFG